MSNINHDKLKMKGVYAQEAELVGEVLTKPILVLPQ